MLVYKFTSHRPDQRNIKSVTFSGYLLSFHHLRIIITKIVIFNGFK